MYRTTVSSLAIALSAPAVAQETTGPDDGEVRAEQIADERRENPVDSIIVVGGRIEVVERLGHQQIGVGIKPSAEVFTLVVEVALYLELDRLFGALGEIS